MKVLDFQLGPILTNCYLAIDEASKECVLIDAPPDSFEVISEFVKNEELTLKAVVLTHSHWDHALDAPKFKTLSNIPIMIHPDDEYRIAEPMKHTVFQIPYIIDSIRADELLTDGTVIKFGSSMLNVLHTPGHTEGSICLFNKDYNILFTGDTLFNESIGRTDLPGGDTTLIVLSLKKLMELPDSISVFSGHGPETTLEYERYNNPFISRLK